MTVKTVWSHDALPLVPPLYRSIYRVFLPFVDGMMILFSIGALIVGSGVVRSFTLPWFPFAWAGLMGTGAILAAVGLILMRDHLELVGKFCLVLALLVYAALLTWDAFTRNPSTILSVIPVIILAAGLALRTVNVLLVIARKEAATS